MGNCTRNQAQLLLAFKVLHFVHQLRKRVKTRVQSGFDDDLRLGNYLQADRKASMRIPGLSRPGARDAKQPQHIGNRISKCRKNKPNSFRPVLRLLTPGSDASVYSNESGEEVQQYVQRSVRLVSCMLSSANSNPSNVEEALTAIASDNKLFLNHASSPILQRCSLYEINWVLLSTFSALQTLSECRSQFGDNWLAAQGQLIGLDVDGTFVANLEHLLLWLQAKLENALVRKVRAELLHPMGGYSKNQRKLLACLDGFAEKPQPLSMSFPWTIKPSLAVLWGVCWMFYDRAGNAPADLEGTNDRVPVTRVLQHVGVPWTAPGSSEYLNFGLEMIGLQPQPGTQLQTGDNMPVGPESDVFKAARNSDTWQSDWHHLNSRHPSLTVSSLSPIVNSGSAIQLPQIHHKHERSLSSTSNTDMPTPVSIAGNDLPSPVGEQHRTTMSSPNTHTRQYSEDISSQDEHDGSLRKNHSYKRAEEPPRNNEAKMICKRSECSGITFDRKCEWSKHMDKHDRPYKCGVKGCEKLQGFTYSGGLLRHEREVHKMHGGTKKSLFCPFADCKRSSGAGFTRKENLAEHIRRVHRRTSMSADMHGLVIRRDTLELSPTIESRQASESPYVRNMEYRDSEEPSLKRKRMFDSVLSDRADEDLRAEIKRLRHENEEKDARLRQLEQAVMALQQSRRS
ncbi:uncharacterized protein M421DRAFT_73168 [Didymella exigua CBS 183.55]|uniref:C2H2-type domain-containing protein n=1 Tax=Didymella exigua CBS 183.55 TaxID=1150837 RepID=A0A6A5R8Z2_9PLEO|nr:uncharacterized protein M421DRAFT_73168 [Didymella exigua CBS 183.55]KAF1924212.1 hypothetical protein M421DRAFT_73168 [Didymella exigua CBS 183.55]